MLRSENKSTGFIYVLSDPDTGEVRYIGQARNLEEDTKSIYLKQV